MRTTKLGAVLASLAITTGTAAVLSAAPAQAEGELPTTAQLTLTDPSDGHQYTGWLALYGNTVGTLTTTISDGTTTPVPVGTATLEQRLPGKDWKNAKTDTNVADGVSFGSYGTKAKGNVRYRVHYSGGVDPTTMTTYDESYSNTVTVRTMWNLHDRGACAPKCRIFGKLAPRAKNHKVLIQYKHHGWKRYKVVRTNKRSRWAAFVKPTRGKGTLYRAVVAGTRDLTKGYSTIYRAYIISRSAPSLTRR